MKCDNCFCIYQKDGKCVLETISLDVMGQCLDCVYVDIDEKTLEKLKSEQMKKIPDV